jgi:hypothetical protein
MVSHNFSKALLIFPYSFFSSDFIISIGLSPSLLILSPANSNIFLSASSEFFPFHFFNAFHAWNFHFALFL